MLILAKFEAIIVPTWAIIGVLVAVILVIGLVGVVVFALTRKPHR